MLAQKNRLGASWAVLEASWAVLEASWRVLKNAMKKVTKNKGNKKASKNSLRRQVGLQEGGAFLHVDSGGGFGGDP